MAPVVQDVDKEAGKGGRSRRLGLKEVRGLGPSAAAYDPSLPGFGARRRNGAAVSYFVLYYTADGRRRRFTIGQHGMPWTPDTAREKALEILADVKVRGADPAAAKKARRQAATVGELCDLYIEEAEAGRLLTRRGGTKKASTLATDRSRISAHIKPILGKMKVPAVKREDVEAFMHSVAAGTTRGRSVSGKKGCVSNVRGGKGASSRTVGLLGAIFTFAVRNRMRSDNPVRGVVRHADGSRGRRLADQEYAAIGRGLIEVAKPPPRKTPPSSASERQGMWPDALAASRFLLLTGWRSGEALSLRWENLDLERRTARLPDTKSGLSIRPLSQAACDVLHTQPRGKPDALVFRASRGTGVMSGFPSFFARIVKAGRLPVAITPHVLRHSFASLAGDLGYSETTIAALVGHKGQSITSRYVHAADAVLLAAADSVAARTVELMAALKQITSASVE